MLRKDSIPSEYNTGDVRVFATRMLLNSQADRYHPLDGQLVPRSGDAGLLAAITAGEVPSCSDAEWLSNKSKRGMYTLGDGSTNIRLPDWNGKSDKALGAPVIRGDGLNSGGLGIIQGDAMRVMTGSLSALFRAATVGASGVLKVQQYGDTPPMPGTTGAHQGDSVTIEFSNKGVVPTGPEYRMVNTSGVHAVKR